MNKIGSMIAIIILSLCINGQQTKSPNGESVAKTAPADPSPAPIDIKGGKVEVPPEKARPIVITKTSAPPLIDGKFDEPAWKDATVFKDFYQTQPGYNTAPSRLTEVYVMYDEHNLYVAFKCWDEKDKIRATVTKRDNVFGEDNVRMWLDTYDDHRRAYVLGFNPLGVQQDGIFTEGQGPDFSVDIVMDSKGVIEDWGWSVEVKIPFKSLRYSAGKGKLWGFNVARNINRFNDEFDSWMPDDRDVSGQLIKYGRISGLDEVKYERTLEVVPSVTLSETGERVSDNLFPPGRFVNHQIKKDIGVNLKYTLSPNVTFDGAINPDYAEIEADAPVVSANQRFPIFFEEKRPFFLEGKDIFNSPLQPFYSRTIVDPDVALKLTGKINKTSFGILAASDNAPGNYSENERTLNSQCLVRQLTNPLIRCSINEFLDKNALFGVVRLKRDFGASNSIGFFGTARVFPKNRNFVGGFDGIYKFNSSTVMTFQALGTYSRKTFYDPNTDRSKYRTGNGFGYYWSLDTTKETHGWYAEVSGRTKDFRTDAGFARRTDSNTVFLANRWSIKSRPKATLIGLNTNQFVKYSFDWRGRLQYVLGGAGMDIQLKGNISFNFEVGNQYEKIYEEEFGPKCNPATGQAGGFFGAPTRGAPQPYFNFYINKTFNKKLSVYGFVASIWGTLDYDFGGGNGYPRASAAYTAWVKSGYVGPEPALDPGPGREFDVNVGFTYKPIDQLTTSLNFTKSKLTRNDTGLVAYDTNIFQWKTTYQFTRFTYVRVRWDYDTLSSNASGQFLFGINPSPGTAFYVGYNDNLNYNGFNRYNGQLEPGFARNSRTFFIRASYLFRKSF